MKNKTVMLLGLLVVMAVLAGCLLISLGGAPAATILASDIMSTRVDAPQIALPDSSSSITMTVGELTRLLSEVFRHDEQMQKDALDTVRDVAVSADIAASASNVGRSLATGVIGLGLIAIFIVTVMVRGD